MHDLMTAKEAAHYLRLGLSTLARYRMDGNGPPFCLIGRNVLYKRSDLEAYVEQNMRYSTPSRASPLTGRIPGVEDV